MEALDPEKRDLFQEWDQGNSLDEIKGKPVIIYGQQALIKATSIIWSSKEMTPEEIPIKGEKKWNWQIFWICEYCIERILGSFGGCRKSWQKIQRLISDKNEERLPPG